MPVQIPEIKRTEAPAPESVGRVNVQVPNTAAAMDVQSNAADKLGNSLEDLAMRYEDHAADTEATKASTAYGIWYDKKIDGDSDKQTPGLKHIQGDPTEAYNAFDKEAQDKMNEILNNSNYSPKVRDAVEKALARKHAQKFDHRLEVYGHQNAVYEEKVTDAAVNQEKSSAADTLNLIDSTDPNSVMMFNKSLDQIDQLRVAHAAKMGAFKENPIGKYSYTDVNGKEIYGDLSPVIAREIAKDKSQVIHDSIVTLIESRQLDKAKMLMDNYSTELDPVNKGKVIKEFAAADVKEKAYSVLASLDNKPYKDVVDYLKAPAKDAKEAEVKLEALNHYANLTNVKENLQKKDSTDNYNLIANAVDAKMRSDIPYSSVQDMENSTIMLGGHIEKVRDGAGRLVEKMVGGEEVRFKDAIQRVTENKQRDAIYKVVEQPKSSDPDAIEKLAEIGRQRGFVGMPFPAFQEIAQSLNKEDHKTFFNWWKQSNSETDAQTTARMQHIDKLAYDAYSAANLIKTDFQGRETQKSKARRDRFLMRINQQQFLLPPGMDYDSQTKWVEQEMANEAIRQQKEDIQNSPSRQFLLKHGIGTPPPEEKPVEFPRPKYQGGEQRSTPMKSKSSKDVSTMSDTELNTAIDMFTKEKGRAPKDSAEIQSWINSQ